MAREQEAAPNPLQPVQPKAGSFMPPNDKPHPPTSDFTFSDPRSLSSPQPVFGQTTDLSVNASPLATKKVAHPPVAARQRDSNFDNLFAPKRRELPPQYHKPPQSRNPLSQVGRSVYDAVVPAANESRKLPPPARPQEDDVFFISKPSVPPSTSWSRPQPQSFSTASNTNPFHRIKPDLVNFAAPRKTDDDGFNDQQVFGDDRFGTTDPLIYLDSTKANDNIKALLEGAMDDEDDRPRTRRKKKQQQQQQQQLEAKIDGLAVKIEATSLGQENIEEVEEEVDDGTREGLRVRLLPHQIEGVDWMKTKEMGTKKIKGILPKGGILADDMGLGKTIQSIALILSNKRPTDEELKASKRKLNPETGHSTLVVAPLALIKQWEREISDRVEKDHKLNVLVHHGPQRSKSCTELSKYDVVITTYQTVSSEYANGNSSPKSALFAVNWYRLILDEAHSIKNRNAKSTMAACALNAEYRWCLTGTPMQNNLDELQSLIHFLQIKPYNDLEVWREQITKPMNNGRGGLSIRRLRAFLSAFMKRRTKDVLKMDEGAQADGKDVQSKNGFKIVKRTINTVEADFTEQERAFYTRLEARTDRSLAQMMSGNQMSYANALVLLLRLRQACNHPKLLGVDLAAEQEALAGSRTPSRKASKADEIDDIAAMLGGLSVDTKRCDVCQIELDQQAVEDGFLRCSECEDDLKQQDQSSLQKLKASSKRASAREGRTNRKVVLDSDDEDEDDSYTLDEAQGQLDVATSTKIRHLVKILQQDSDTHKYIVFSFFTSMLNLIEPFLKHHNISFVRYDGKMRNDAREAALESLRSNARTRVLLCSLRAGSLGLNLTAASRVVILEPFWNPFVEEQAIDRVHRLNQTQDVIVHKLTIKDTVEARILELQERKRELAQATIEGQKGMGAGKLTLKEMLKLFKHDSENDAKLDMIGMKDRRGILDRGESTTEPDLSRRSDSRAGERGEPRGPGRTEDPVYGRRW